MKASASFQTPNASRYLAMLCTHFNQRATAQCDDQTGWVQFPFGRCDMQADASQLHITAAAQDQTHLDQVMQIITNHLERFAFRERPLLDWEQPSDQTATAIPSVCPTQTNPQKG